mgnify:CR=1 FL=1
MNVEQLPPTDPAPVIHVDAELADLVPRYINNRWSDLNLARSLLAGRDFEQLAKIAHRIRGSAASYGFVGLGQIAGYLQQAAFNADSGNIERALDRYEQYLRNAKIRFR